MFVFRSRVHTFDKYERHVGKQPDTRKNSENKLCFAEETGCEVFICSQQSLPRSRQTHALSSSWRRAFTPRAAVRRVALRTSTRLVNSLFFLVLKRAHTYIYCRDDDEPGTVVCVLVQAAGGGRLAAVSEAGNDSHE